MIYKQFFLTIVNCDVSKYDQLEHMDTMIHYSSIDNYIFSCLCKPYGFKCCKPQNVIKIQTNMCTLNSVIA